LNDFDMSQNGVIETHPLFQERLREVFMAFVVGEVPGEMLQ